MEFSISSGFDERQRTVAAQLLWQAFRGKLGLVMKPDEKAVSFFEHVLRPDHAVSATTRNGRLIGLAGFKTPTGSFMGGSFSDLVNLYGWFGGVWRGLVLSLLERDLAPDTLLMDGIFVDESARGFGVGTALLEAMKQKAVDLNCKSLRLDVIDINPRARALYEREGFVAVGTKSIGPLRQIFGFSKSTAMVCKLN